MGLMHKSGPVVDLFDYACKLPRMAGVLPFIIRGTTFQVSKMLVLYDVVLVLIHLLIDTFLSYLAALDYSTMSFVSWLIRIAQQVTSSGTIAISLFWIIRSKPTLQEALDELVKFEEIVRPKDTYLSHRLLGLIYATLFAIGVMDFFLLDPMIPFLIRIMVSARFHISTWMMFSISANFTSLIKIVDKSYQALSDSMVSSKKASQNLKDTQKAAEHLVCSCEAINATFGPQMLLITSASFVLITGNIYLALMHGLTNESFIAVSWILIFTKVMLHLISSCTSAVQAADEFEKTLYRTVLEDRSGNLSQEVRSCLHFTNNRKVEFNAFGFFAINFSLAGSMIAAATTYLVILIQIGSSEKTETNATSSYVNNSESR